MERLREMIELIFQVLPNGKSAPSSARSKAYLLTDNWETFHWFANTADRDAALADMSRRHEFSRRGDVPTVKYQPVER